MSDLDAPVGLVKLEQMYDYRTTILYAKKAVIEGMPA